MRGVAEATTRYVSDVIATLSKRFDQRFDQLDDQIKQIPAGPQGEKGEPGLPGESIKGEPGEHGEKGEKGDKGEAGWGGQGDKGERGEKGDPGESIQGERGERGESGQKGEKGDTGTPGERGLPGERGEDGLTVIGEKGEKGLDGKDGRDGREGKDGRDGAPGRDALEIDVLSTIDEAKSYPRGTFASFRNGFLRARMNTSPIGEGSLEECGWDIIVNGWAPPEFEQGEDPREVVITWRQTSGTPTVFKAYIPFPLYRDIWRDTETYRKGDTVTRDGSLWHCNTDQTKVPPGTPNTKDWTLCVKHGRDGKPGLNGKDGERGKDGPPGRDLTQVDFNGNKH